LFDSIGFYPQEEELAMPNLQQEPQKRPIILRAWIEFGLLALYHKKMSGKLHR
jgi:hypothetical protein